MGKAKAGTIVLVLVLVLEKLGGDAGVETSGLDYSTRPGDM